MVVFDKSYLCDVIALISKLFAIILKRIKFHNNFPNYSNILLENYIHSYAISCLLFGHIYTVPYAKGKFGRILGDFMVYDPTLDAWRPVTSVMSEEGHCVPYYGGSKEDTQAQHMVNRRKLIEAGIVNMTLEKAGLI